MQKIRPDQGMSALYPAAPPEEVAPGPSSPAAPAAGAELDLMARLAIAVDTAGSAAARLAAAAARDRLSWDQCHPILVPTLSRSTAGTLQDSDRWGPRQGWAWFVTRLTGILGTGASAITYYRDAAIPSNTILGPVSGGTWEPKSLILLPGQQFTASADGGFTINGEGVEIDINELPRFLM